MIKENTICRVDRSTKRRESMDNNKPKKKKKLIVVFHPEHSGCDESGPRDDRGDCCGSPFKMNHVGNGVYCDDDGDNFDFF